MEYIVEEAESIGVGFHKEESLEGDEPRPAFLDALEARLPLLLESINEEFFPSVVKQIASYSDDLKPWVDFRPWFTWLYSFFYIYMQRIFAGLVYTAVVPVSGFYFT